LVLSVLSGGVWAAAAMAQPCEPHWERGAAIAPDAGVHALAAINEGGSLSLYAGGRFTTIGGVAAERIARLERRRVVSAWLGNPR
jgi:hypothetical protein